jgi:hypothetical protein
VLKDGEEVNLLDLIRAANGREKLALALPGGEAGR